MYLATQSSTQVFNLFGGAYIQEQHDKGVEPSRRFDVPEPTAPQPSAATSKDEREFAAQCMARRPAG